MPVNVLMISPGYPAEMPLFAQGLAGWAHGFTASATNPRVRCPSRPDGRSRATSRRQTSGARPRP